MARVGLIDKSIFLLVLPGVFYLFIFTIYPIVSNFVFSFYTFDFLGNLMWVGLDNYQRLMIDPYIGMILKNTLIYTVVVPAVTVILALPIAVSLKKLGSVLLPILVMPAFIPAVTAAVMWYLMLNPFFGLSYYLTPNYNWAASIWTVVIVEIWRALPMSILVLYSGLRAIPKEIEEAASSDGLTGPRKFLMVDFPLIIPQVLIAYVLTMISGFFIFDPIYIGTSQAGPRVLDNLAYYAFDVFYSDIRMRGYAAALIFLMTILATFLSLVYVRVMNTKIFVKLPTPSFIPSRELPKVIHAFVIFAALSFVLFPMLWMIFVSLKTPLELLSIPPSIIPEKPVMNSYLSVFKDGSPYLITSLGITLINTMITLLLSSMLAYAIAVHKFSGEKLLMYIFYLLATPTLIYIVPLFSVLRILNLINTWWGLILTYPIMTLPISTWIMYNYYSRFPKHVDESAQMDGMNKFKAFVKMALPLSKSGLSVAAVYTFTYSWSALIFPLAFTYTPYDLSNPFSFSGAQTFSIYIGMLMSPVASNYVNVAAAGLISIVPPLILLILARKNLETMWGGK